jgi:MFS transporter, DHA2 family, methylenomycin A resistance protein
LRRPVFSATITIAGLMTFGMYALLFIMPLYFQTMRGASPLIAGLELLPMPVSFFLVSQLVGYLNNQLGPRIVMTAGMTCMGVGALALAFINGNTSLFFTELALLIVGVGLGPNTAPVHGVAVAALPPERSGTASGVLNTSRMVGATLGVAILGAVFAAYAGQIPTAGEGFLSGLRAALTGSGVAELIGAAIAITFIRRDSLHPQK